MNRRRWESLKTLNAMHSVHSGCTPAALLSFFLLVLFVFALAFLVLVVAELALIAIQAPGAQCLTMPTSTSVTTATAYR